MILASNFKKDISKTFSGRLKEIGFKGSGFNYLLDSKNFVFTVGIQASQYGGQCCAEFGIQPKSLDTNGFAMLDFSKLKYFNCELRTRIAPAGKSDKWWKYSEDENKNIKIALEIIELIESQYVPVIKTFIDNPNILESIEISDLENNYQKVTRKLHGMSYLSNLRFVWVLAKIHEKVNIARSKEFAEYGLSKLKNNDTFFAKADFEKILKINNGA